MIMLDDVKKNPLVHNMIKRSNDALGVLGYTEHGFRHLGLVAHTAKNILLKLGHSEREGEMAAIAGYMHDIGNVVHRKYHAEIGASLAFKILVDMQMDPEEIAAVVAAIGNHDERNGIPVSNIASALILADKADVHRTRVRNLDFATFDIHDRVNYAVEFSSLNVNPENRTINLELKIDTEICPVLEYFEIFLARMVLSRRAADFLSCEFKLNINGATLL